MESRAVEEVEFEIGEEGGVVIEGEGADVDTDIDADINAYTGTGTGIGTEEWGEEELVDFEELVEAEEIDDE